MPHPSLRFELNRNVKQVLVQHAVDLTKLNFSCAHEVVYLFGWLAKDPEGDFSPSQIQSMVKSIQSVPGIRQIHLQIHNWQIRCDQGCRVVNKTAG